MKFVVIAQKIIPLFTAHKTSMRRTKTFHKLAKCKHFEKPGISEENPHIFASKQPFGLIFLDAKTVPSSVLSTKKKLANISYRSKICRRVSLVAKPFP